MNFEEAIDLAWDKQGPRPTAEQALAIIVAKTSKVSWWEGRLARTALRTHLKCRPETFEDIKHALRAKYPEPRLSFGYIGNCSSFDPKCPAYWDDRLWMFFTKVPKPYKQYGKSGTFSLTIGSTKQTEEEEKNHIDWWFFEIEVWMKEVVVPHQADVYRSFNVETSMADATYAERLLGEAGASFGGRGCGRFNFSIRYWTLDDIKRLLPFATKVEMDRYD